MMLGQKCILKVNMNGLKCFKAAGLSRFLAGDLMSIIDGLEL